MWTFPQIVLNLVSGIAGNSGIFDMYTNNSETTTYRLAIVVNDAYNGLDIFVNASWRISAVDMSLASNICYHFALVKNGSTTTLYKDGFFTLFS